MKLTNIRDIPDRWFTYSDDTVRDSFIQCHRDVRLTGRSICYPNCLVWSPAHETLIHPYDERVMSLQRDSFYENDEWPEFTPPAEATTVESKPAFFFVYNVDNYFHYIYDTLTLLVSYFKIREAGESDLVAILSTSHPSKSTLPRFVTEFLDCMGVSYQLADPATQYTKLYITSSFTHGRKSNSPPSPVLATLVGRFKPKGVVGQSIQSLSKKFYISRRSWKHAQRDNMGTNYTERRKCMNEDDVVALLEKYDIKEVFTELLTTEEKLQLFSHAEVVVGVIGGGMCNLMFARPDTKTLCIPTPYFREINSRFEYSMNSATLAYSECASHWDWPHRFKLYSRVKVVGGSDVGRVGEIEGFNEETRKYLVILSSNDIAGFSQDFTAALQKVEFAEEELEALDEGLNSPYICDIAQLEIDLKRLLGC